MDELKAAEPPAIPPKSARRHISKAANDQAYARYQAQRDDFDPQFTIPPLNPARRRSQLSNSSTEHSPEPSKKRQISISSDSSSENVGGDQLSPLTDRRGRTSLVYRLAPKLRRSASSEFLRFGSTGKLRTQRHISSSGRPVISSPRGVHGPVSPILTAPVVTASDIDGSTAFTEKEIAFLRSKGIDPTSPATPRSATVRERSRWRTSIATLPGMPHL